MQIPPHKGDVGFEALATGGEAELDLWWDDEVTGRRVPVQGREYYMSRDSVFNMLRGFVLAHRMCPTLQFSGVMECGLELNPTPPHVLRFAHVRHDKKTANTPLTVAKTIQTIRDNVSRDLLTTSLTAPVVAGAFSTGAPVAGARAAAAAL
jgi:hypothetical protein